MFYIWALDHLITVNKLSAAARDLSSLRLHEVLVVLCVIRLGSTEADQALALWLLR